MIKKYLRSLLSILGYEIQKNPSGELLLGYMRETEACEILKIVRPYTMLSRLRLVVLFQQVEHCERNAIPGSYVECGVWKGGAMALMALTNQKYGTQPRHLHLFDAFEEICAPNTDLDGEKALNESAPFYSKDFLPGERKPLKGIYDRMGGPGSLEGNVDLLEKSVGYNSDYCHYHKGWFQDTIPNEFNQIEQIAILRLDGDWYESTKICLDYLYDKVVPGGFIIIDDYIYYDGCTKAVDDFIRERKITSFLNQVDKEGCIYWIKE